MQQHISLSNIENFTYLFSSGNDQFNDISWVEPIFIAMTRAYQNDEKISVQISNTYFRDMILKEYQSNKTYSPIENVFNRTSLDEISDHLTSIMLKNFKDLSDSDLKDLRDYLQYLFIELMNNVADHSHSPVGGYVMAQYYKTNKKVQFVVADRGIAFLENMLLNFSDIDNEEKAILKALKKGATSTKQMMYGKERNAGYGLYAMFEILKMTGGCFVIISNDTLIRYENEVLTTKILDNPWKGVVVAFEFFEANINHDMDYFKRNYLWNEIMEDGDEDFF
jgi:anti-sigma regulatory factor (Ser/Thr protein kinase)